MTILAADTKLFVCIIIGANGLRDPLQQVARGRAVEPLVGRDGDEAGQGGPTAPGHGCLRGVDPLAGELPTVGLATATQAKVAPAREPLHAGIIRDETGQVLGLEIPGGEQVERELGSIPNPVINFLSSVIGTPKQGSGTPWLCMNVRR